MKKVLVIMGLVMLAGITLQAQKIKHLTAEEFKKEVFDYKNESDWKFKGNVPVVIDFYATWCGPCRRVAPILKELQKEYGNKLQIYKVDVDKEKELAGVFGISSMPTYLLIPKEGKPTMMKGAMPKESFKQAFKQVFGL